MVFFLSPQACKPIPDDPDVLPSWNHAWISLKLSRHCPSLFCSSVSSFYRFRWCIASLENYVNRSHTQTLSYVLWILPVFLQYTFHTFPQTWLQLVDLYSPLLKSCLYLLCGRCFSGQEKKRKKKKNPTKIYFRIQYVVCLSCVTVRSSYQHCYQGIYIRFLTAWLWTSKKTSQWRKRLQLFDSQQLTAELGIYSWCFR